MRIFHIHADRLSELSTLPDAAPDAGYLWVGIARDELERSVGPVQAALQRWTGAQLVDLHVADLLNDQLPSSFDYTSQYDLLVFRRLAAASIAHAPAEAEVGTPGALTRVDTQPVGFAVFDGVLLTVHPTDCLVRDFFANRLQQQRAQVETRNATRVPPNTADLAMRMVNHMVDGYLELRRTLSRQLDDLQRELFSSSTRRDIWKLLLDSRNGLHLLEDTCEDQRAAITEWIDAQDELPQEAEASVARERELLRVRSRDLLEHIERVLSHVRRLESSAENAVQMHFSAQSNRTNEIMRTLTVLTAIFLPLNLVTGFFGMNFEALPLIHAARGLWWTLGFMLILGGALSWYFWRKRYLERPR